VFTKIALGIGSADNETMNDSWRRRIRRAEELARQHPFAAEILGFYIDLIRFQEDTYHELQRSNAPRPQPASLADQLWQPELSKLISRFASFLNMVEAKGPDELAKLSHGLLDQNEKLWSDLLNSCWTTHSPSDTQGLLARAFLQPYAEFLRSGASAQANNYTYAICPFCSRKPCLGVMRQRGDGASRSLICSFCAAEWEFRRIVCPACGEEDSGKLPLYTAPDFDYIRIECCDGCKTYLKTVDLTKNGLAEPLVDEIASAPLDLWAQEHGYSKLELNLVGT
jgi:FdhE protein